MKTYLFCIVIMVAHEAACKTAQEHAQTVFDAIDRYEKELPTAIDAPQGVLGKPIVQRVDLRTAFEKSFEAVRAEIEKKPSLIAELGAIRNSKNETLIDRALRFEKTDTILAQKKAVLDPPSDMFPVLYEVMTIVLPDQAAYDAIEKHAQDLANAREVDRDDIINLVRVVLSGVDALETKWSESPLVARKIFDRAATFKNLFIDDMSEGSRLYESLRRLLMKKFTNDDDTVADFVLPWVVEKLGKAALPWKNLSGKNIQTLLLKTLGSLLVAVPDPKQENLLAAILMRTYAERQKNMRTHRHEDPLAKSFRDFLITFVQDSSQKLGPLLDGKGNFINPLVYAIEWGDAELFKAALAKEPRLGTIGARGRYEIVGDQLELKDSQNLYDGVVNPDFVSVMATSGVTLPPRLTEERIRLSLKQLTESLHMLARQ